MKKTPSGAWEEMEFESQDLYKVIQKSWLFWVNFFTYVSFFWFSLVSLLYDKNLSFIFQKMYLLHPWGECPWSPSSAPEPGVGVTPGVSRHSCKGGEQRQEPEDHAVTSVETVEGSMALKKLMSISVSSIHRSPDWESSSPQSTVVYSWRLQGFKNTLHHINWSQRKKWF